MSLKKMMLSGAAAVALVGTAAFATTVATEQDGTGNYLLAPVYYAIDNWSTELKVVNTNTTSAVVAKVVIRESQNSEEVRDFPIYLTPGDVWVGTLKQDAGIRIVSTDDSIMLGIDPATGKPKTVADLNVTLASKGENRMGYVEIIGLAEYNQTVLQEWDPDWKPGCEYNKTILFQHVRDIANPASLNSTDAVMVDKDALMGMQTIYATSDVDQYKRGMMLNLAAFNVADVDSNDWTTALGKAVSIETTYMSDISAVTPLHTELNKKEVYVMYESKNSPIKTHFTYPYKGVGNDYNISSATTEFRNLSETVKRCYDVNHTNPCALPNTGNDLSGDTPTYETCDVKEVTTEVAVIFNNDPDANVNDAWMTQYGFTEGGYVTIKLGEGEPVIPTTFYSKKMGGLYLNNHLYNQYRK